MAGDNRLNPKRVQVDLKNFYNDHRAKAYVACNKFEKVIDLQEHIQRIFFITGEIYLTTEDQSLLPPMETIYVIHSTDIIRVHPVNPYTELANALSHAHINSGIDTPTLEVPSKRKKKRLDDGSACTGKRANWIDDVNAIDEVPESISAETDEIEQRKRKRTRKRKSKTPLVSPPPKPQPKRPILFIKAEQEPQSTFKKRISHVRFEDDMDSDSGDDKVAVQAVVKDVEYPAKARVIRAKVCKGEQQSSSKVITPTLQEDETIAPIETEIANSNDVNASTMDVSDIEKPITVQKASGESSVELLRKNIHNMELSSAVGLLKANDVIAFKMYKMGENYMPELSEFIIGIIQDITSAEEVIINVLAGFEETKEPGGRFSMKDDEEESEEDVVVGVGLLTTRLADILEPKFVNLNV